ncbi:Glutamate receptor ionotropic like protein [Argiope bruennichi]|uniref:Glutamate receptor ionotropic like protein n=1 Tax=Argiope bruennichi TaxID=94029 RepID=A0A8T0E6A9_ARGBR|nr:Glutamate receptor ionotropic like protein [Argiope bruennichi]
MLEGIEGRFLDLLSKTLRFRYRLKTAPDGEPGKMNKNGSWTGLIGMLQRKEIDMALNFLCPTEERTKVVDFTDSYEVDYVKFLVDKPGAVPLKLSLLYPFNSETWICIFLIMVIGPKVLILMFRLKVSYMKLFLQLLGSFLNQAFTIPLLGTRNRIIFFSWCLFAMLVSMYYSSTLLSFLTFPLQKAPLKNFTELSEAVGEGTHRCFTLKGSFALTVFHSSPHEPLRNLGRAIEDNGWFFDKHDNFGSLRKILKKTAVMDIRLKLELLHNSLHFDSYIMSDENLISLNFAIALRKDFCCKESLNSVISAVTSAGIYTKFEREEIFKVFLKEGLLHKTVNSAELKIDDLYGVFILLIVGYGVSLVVVISEIVYFSYIEKCKTLLF